MRRILHVLEHSFPRLVGYTVRSKFIVDKQLKEGLYPVVITSPLQQRTRRHLNDYEEIDSVRYYRTGRFNNLKMERPLPLRLLQRYAYSRAYLKAIKWVAEKEKVQIIHSHSSYLNGVRGNEAARMIGIPSVYEVRGLWHETGSVIDGIRPTHWKYRFVDYMDWKAMFGADKVVTISQQLKAALIDKGVAENRVFVVPNGVDTHIFSPRQKNPEILKKYRLQDKLVMGFIGSIRRIEGLSLFLKNLNRIIRRTKRLHVLIVGDGNDVSRLKEIIRLNYLQRQVTFVGRVEHNSVLNYYSVMDVLVYPRINARVNQIVTPLKPLEAMAMEKAVLASDVGGLRELIKDDNTGLLFHADDADDLVRKCLVLIEHPSLIKDLGQRARTWAIQEREWSKVIKQYEQVYSTINQPAEEPPF